ncbi:hypothetical protein KIH77_08680 [Bifidobacterium sp. 82T24]|uniref:hypothetical protein n=1 Tax=Bifidobacterium pluvialisilvae TaxID=2834436 RepID=UPI001C55FCBC|nr:hypothetical protein [Bifidobacterium pluvialisilvae]MBW3088797.1 hypothetical protein [Bifidobacterium pluvialisilvae]
MTRILTIASAVVFGISFATGIVSVGIVATISVLTASASAVAYASLSGLLDRLEEAL